MKKLLLFFSLITTTILSAQTNPKIEWDRTFGGKGVDITHDVIQSVSGNIVLVGETTDHHSNEKDGLFVIVNNKGESIVERIIGGNGGEVIRSIVELNDGNFAVTGYRKTGKNTQRGWIAKLNSVGGLLWEKTIGQSGMDDLYDVIQTTDGGLAFTGITEVNKNKDMWILKTDQTGSLLWERNFGAGKPEGGRSIVETEEGGFAIAGFTDSKGEGKTDFWLVKTDNKGALLWDKTYGFNKWEEAYSMIKTNDGGFFLVGYNSSDKFNIWTVKTDKSGNMLREKEYGGSDFDDGWAVTETYDGGFMIAGSTRSHKMGARNTRLWLLKIDKDGKEIIKEAYYGGKREDKPKAIIQTSSGDFVVVGSTESDGIGKSDFWAFQVDGSSSRPTETRGTTIETEFIGFQDDNKNGILDANEQGTITIKVTNTGTVNAFGIEGLFMINSMVEGVAFPKQVNVGALKSGQSRVVSIPMVGTEKLQTGNITFSLAFSDANNSKISSISHDLQTEELPRPNVMITNHSIAKSEDGLLLGTPATLKIQLKNMGKKMAKDTKITFSHPNQLIAKSPNSSVLPILDAQKSNEAIFDFEIDKSYTFRSIPITCIIKKENGDTLKRIIKIEIDQPKPKVVTQVKIPTIIRWHSPDIDFYRNKPLKLRNENLYVKLKIEGSQEYIKKDFIILVDGKPYRQSGSKFDEATLTRTGKNKRQQYTFTYEDTLSFEEERIYKIMLQLKEDKEITSEELTIAYSNEKPNLHVLAVGTKTNLEYTMQDAKDFAALYQAQGQKESRLFGYVEVKSVLGEEATASKIIEEVEKLQVKYLTEDITSNDMIIIFMSSHGFMLNDEFYIQGDNYRTGLHRSRAVQFSEMMEILNEIKCKKLIFVDACHSGGAKGVSSFAINEAIKELNTKREGTTTIVSSNRDELSYEDKEWENGAFTEGIMKALEEGKADKDKNGIVNIAELFTYISKVVPEMVEDIKGQPQTPQMVKQGLGNVGIYIFE